MINNNDKMCKMISIIIPVYNEDGNIARLYDEIIKVLKDINYDYEIIFINDGSTDNSEKKILDVVKYDNNVKLISFTKNFGHQVALIAGYNNCSGNIAITMDADLQHPPELIKDLIGEWEKGYDIVNTTRLDRFQKSTFKRFTSKYFYKIFSYMANIPIKEGNADFRLINRKVIENINNLKEYDIFLRGMFCWFGFKNSYIEYMPNKRFSGGSKYNIKKMIGLAISGITSFSIVPLRMATMLGFFISGVSTIYIVFLLYKKFFIKGTIDGWPSLILLLLGGIQLISIGIIGEYVGKTYMETKERPRYIIRSQEGFK